MITAGRKRNDVNRGYVRRLRVALVFAAAVHAVAALSYPQSASFFPLPRTVGYEGPVRLYPQLSVQREVIAEREERAARWLATGSAFRVENLDFGAVTAETGEELKQLPVAHDRREVRVSPDDDIAFALRTLGLPEVTVPEDYLIHLEKPVYPADALELGLEGRIVLRALVDTEGNVRRVHVEESHVSPSMQRAAIDAVYKCRFRAYHEDGKPTDFWARFPIVFRIITR